MNKLSTVLNVLNTKKYAKKYREITRIIEKSSKYSLSDLYGMFKFAYRNPCVDMLSLLAYLYLIIEKELDKRLYKEQLLGILAMLDGYILEMATGEGKTLVQFVVGVCNTLYGKVYQITCNDYLAQRDFLYFRDILENLGINACYNPLECDKAWAYSNDLLFMSGSTLAFDYLSNDFKDLSSQIDFRFDTVIIDEIDYILLDNALSEFNMSVDISEKSAVDIGLIQQVLSICKDLTKVELHGNITCYDMFDAEQEHIGVDYIINKYSRDILVTQRGLNKLERIFNVKLLVNKHSYLYQLVLDVLHVLNFIELGRDYKVVDNKIVLIDTNNGRALIKNRFSDGIHTIVEVNENVEVTEDNNMTSSVSYQILLSKFKNVLGCSGTVTESLQEFDAVLGLPVYKVDRHKEYRGIQHRSMFFKFKTDKYRFVVDKIREKYKRGQPVLCVMPTESSVLELESLLELPHNTLLSGVSFEEETKVISNAGKKYAITLTTSLCGRGTDIITDEAANAVGGLFVLIFEHYLSKRIEDQISGRTARQGRIGEILGLSALEDNIWEFARASRLRKLKDIPIVEFYSKGVQRRIGHEIGNIQANWRSVCVLVRKDLMDFNVIEDIHKQHIFKSKKMYLEMVNNPEVMGEVLDSLLRYVVIKCDLDLFSNDYLKTLLNDAKTSSVDFYTVKNTFLSGINEFKLEVGSDYFRLFWVEQISTLFLKEYNCYKKSIELIKKGIHFRSTKSLPIILQYIDVMLQCKRELELQLGIRLIEFVFSLLDCVRKYKEVSCQ